jgi:hypothetical protein
MESVLFNPAVAIPLGAFAVAIMGIVMGSVSQMHTRRMKAEERLALIARGVPLADLERMMLPDRQDAQRSPGSPTGRMRGSRTTALVLIGVGLGLALFGAVLSMIERDRDTLVVSAVGIIPFVLGLAFFVDYRLQKAETDRSALGAG